MFQPCTLFGVGEPGKQFTGKHGLTNHISDIEALNRKACPVTNACKAIESKCLAGPQKREGRPFFVLLWAALLDQTSLVWHHHVAWHTQHESDLAGATAPQTY
jgi:hypothetical protein